MANTNINASAQSRAAYKGQLTVLKRQLEKYIDDPEELESENALTDLLTFKDTAERIERRYQDVQTAIISNALPEMLKAEEDELQTFLADIDDVSTKISRLIAEVKAKNADRRTSINTPETSADFSQVMNSFAEQLKTQQAAFVSLIKDQQKELQSLRQQLSLDNPQDQSTPKISDNSHLEPLKIPQFTGLYSEWKSFQDIFIAVVDSKVNLTNAEKMHYLKTSVKGEPHQVIDNLPICNANYKIAWEMLQEKYEDEFSIANAYIDSFLNQPAIVKPSAAEIRRLQTTSSSLLQALEAIKITDRDPWLINLILKKLDNETQQLWSRHSSRKITTWDNFSKFLRERYKTLEGFGATNSKAPPSSTGNDKKPPKAKCGVTNTGTGDLCKHCNKHSHKLFRCREFLKMPASSRLDVVNKLKLCKNCLSESHALNVCAYNPCSHCSQKHNRLLHDAIVNASQSRVPVEPSTSGTLSQPSSSSSSNSFSSQRAPFNHLALSTSVQKCESNFSSNGSNVLLSTAIVLIRNSEGIFHPCRALLDSGSQINFISSRLCQFLKLRTKSTNFVVEGIGAATRVAKKYVEVYIQVRPEDDQSVLPLNCLVLPNIIGEQPSVTLDVSSIHIPQHFQLADPHWYEKQSIDLLIGSQLFWNLIMCGSHDLGPGLPTLRESQLGWLVLGSFSIPSNPTTSACFAALGPSNMESFDSSLRQFWEIDSVPQTSSEKSESIEAEEQFKNTTVRTESGRYMVQLPFKENLSLLENNRSSAVQQYYSLEKKMKSDQNLKDQYNNIIKEYLDLGIVEIVPYEELSEKCYYFPHHCVVKSQAVSTKVRIVFNASSRSRSSLSLNDVLKVGPVVQPELVSVLWRFRVGAVALTCDIVKMYLQTLLYPPHRDFQRFVWRESPDERLKDLRFRTVCFGVKSSPYLATRSLVQLAMEEGEKYATAAQVIQNNFYIDDCLVSAPSVSHMEIIKNELIEVLKSGGMELSKFNSNVPEIMQHTSENILPLSEVPISDQQTKTLGMIWCPRTDMFQFKINVDHSEKITKRSILSMLARIFDPIGLLGPILTQARLIFQETWILKLDWDSELGSSDDQGSAELRERWIQFREDLAPLESMEIPRWISNIQFPTRMEIHGFSDASGDAYGAAVYVVCEDAIGNRSARLLTSKSKITPLKQGKRASTFTIPKAELCGALMAATLVKTVSSSLEAEHCFFWCDATVVLHQIHSPHGKREVFVTRRVTDILKVSEAHQWRHVPTKENPADLISRGAGSQQLIDSELWWNGPSWLSQSSDQWPPAFVASSRLDVGSCVTSRVEVSKGRSDDVDDYPSIFEHLITRCSRFQRMKRILAQVLAIVQFWGTTTKRTTRSSKKVSDYPLNNYLSDAELLMLRWNQSIYLSEGLRAVQFNKLESNPKVRYLLKLKPFLDNKCILRVGGRLHFSHESKDVKHPIIIPKSPLAKLIIKEEHERLLHAGPQLLLSSLRQKYWPIDGRNATRKIVRECMVCTRANPRVQEQVMGSLPEHRVTHVRPFMAVGLDFAGPLLIRKGIRRDSTDKAYVAVFVCLSVRAVHLELVSSLHTDNFIAALRRFVARRGIPSHIYSDNGRTFVGADNELKRLLQSSDHQELVARQCEEMSIEWRFQPPYAPHHGGLWEAAVKSFKYHLKRIAGNVIMTFEELSTLLIQIEAVLNSRPLTPVTENVEDLNVLTPGSFLIGRPLCQIPDPDLGTEKYGCLKRWQLCQKISQDLSRRWKMEYLHNLQQRAKWCKSHADLKVGDLVLVKNDQSPSTIWPMGRVIQTFPGIDQRVRVVEIKTSSGIIKRPISQLVKLPFDENPE